VVVGEGDHQLEDQLRYLVRIREGRIGARIAFDADLARRVYAGSDFFLVPSRFEPCGLTQMYAMRYGALPIVTDVGGLHDTVEPMRHGGGRSPNEEAGTGFVASEVSASALRDACLRGLELYRDRAALERAVVRAMRHSSAFAWTEPARKYGLLYESVAPVTARGG
jgi:starch synthase